MDYFRTKSMADLRGEEGGLKRVLTATNLVAARHRRHHRRRHLRPHRHGGGAVRRARRIVLSFMPRRASAALFAGLCYAEFASMIPVAGSAYTYGYATLGEFMAWIIGWDLILEYLFAASTVAVGWSGYFIAFMADLGINIPPALAAFSAVGTHTWLRAATAWRRTCRARSFARWCRCDADGRVAQPAGGADRRCCSPRCWSSASRSRPTFNNVDGLHQARDRAAGDRLRASVRQHRRTGRRSSRPTPATSATSAGAASCAARR